MTENITFVPRSFVISHQSLVDKNHIMNNLYQGHMRPRSQVCHKINIMLMNKQGINASNIYKKAGYKPLAKCWLW